MHLCCNLHLCALISSIMCIENEAASCASTVESIEWPSIQCLMFADQPEDIEEIVKKLVVDYIQRTSFLHAFCWDACMFDVWFADHNNRSNKTGKGQRLVTVISAAKCVIGIMIVSMWA